MTIALYVVGINWGVPFVASLLFMGWLLYVSHDIKFEGIVWFWKVFPAYRFRLISRKSWYARAWEKFYGQAMFLSMIHRDELGPWDDPEVEETIVHELRHVVVLLVLGLLMWILYGLDYVRLAVFTKRDPYAENFFERDAERSVQRWVYRGRPRIFNFGRRR